MRSTSTWCALVTLLAIVLAPGCALTPAAHATTGPEAPTAGPSRTRPPAAGARSDVPRDWRRPTDGVRPWRGWQFVPDDQRQRRRYDYDPDAREYWFRDDRFDEPRVVPELPGERCPADDDLRELAPEPRDGGEA